MKKKIFAILLSASIFMNVIPVNAVSITFEEIEQDEQLENNAIIEISDDFAEYEIEEFVEELSEIIPTEATDEDIVLDSFILENEIEFDNFVNPEFIIPADEDENNIEENIELFSLYPIQTFSTKSIASYTNDKFTEYDLTNYPDGIEIPEHTHIWNKQFDDNYHWNMCELCKIVKDKTNHTLVGNGGAKNKYTNWAGGVYQESCNCGYKGPIQIILMGRYENYRDSQYVNSLTYTGSLSNVKQITNAEFNSLKSTYPANAQTYTWEDPDGDGLGWVFGGGPVIGYDDINGTIELILGAEGNFANNDKGSQFTEYYMLIKYLTSDSSPTLQEYINSLPAKGSLSSASRLYGLKEKYQKVSTSQFSQLITKFKGAGEHKTQYNYCGQEVLTFNNIGYPGNFSYRAPFDICAKNGAELNFYNERSGVCEVCGTSFTGNEEYTERTYLGCHPKLENNASRYDCKGHTVYYKNNIEIATAYCHYWRTNGTTYANTTLIPAAGWKITPNSLGSVNSSGTFTMNTVTVPINYNNKFSYYTNYTYVLVSKGSESRQVAFSIHYNLADYIAPVPYSYSNNTTDNNYWKVTGNGTINNTSQQATVTCSFTDNAVCTVDSVEVCIFDYDKETIISQANGTKWVALAKKNGIWTGNVNIPAEINGYKNIYVQAKDASGNTSELIPMQVSYLDAVSPNLELETDIENNTWSQTKNIYIAGADGFDNVNIGITASDMLNVSNNEYGFCRNFKMTGDVYTPKTIIVYANDATGNLNSKEIVIDKLDNTSPTITKVESRRQGTRNATVTIEANDINTKLNASGSGIKGYALTQTNAIPSETEFQNSNSFNVSKSGKWYAYVIDNAGNITATPTAIDVKIEYTVSLNPNGGTLTGDSNYQVISGESVNIPNPTRTGYTFTGWSISGEGTSISETSLTMGSEDAEITAQWQINQYTVTYIDKTIDGKEISRITKQIDYNTPVSGEDIGHSDVENAYHNQYKYISSTDATVTTDGAVVYRIFEFCETEKESHLTWNDNNNADGLRPEKYTVKLKQKGKVIDEVELPSSQTDYTFEHLPKYDTNGNPYKYEIETIVSDRYEIETDSDGNPYIADYHKSNFSILIPKNIVLDGRTGNADYTVTVNGTFYYNDILTVKPDASFAMTDRSSISSIQANITQPKTGFSKEDLPNSVSSGHIQVNRTYFSGLWQGIFHFNIKFKMNN